MSDDRQALKARFAAFGPAKTEPPPSSATRPRTPISDTLSKTSETPIPMPDGDRILLKIRRNQTKSVSGEIGFSVHFIAELSPSARAAVTRYQLGKAIIYEKDLTLKFTVNVFLMLWRLIWLWLTRKRWRITVNDLVDGRTLTAKSVVEMLNTEDDIRKAADVFTRVLRAAQNFGGEEVVQL